MQIQTTKTNSLLLGAALAGLAGTSPAAKAATVYVESSDFNNDYYPPTNLTGEWTNFVTSGGVAGSLGFDAPADTRDYFRVNAPAGTAVTIPFRMTTQGSVTYPSFEVLDDSGTFVAQVLTLYYSGDLAVGQEFSGNAVFNVPASGNVILGFSNEGGSGTANYTVGATVPEAGSSVLGLAGLAAAALRRRRERSE